jgi:hypothetical protein
MCTLPCTHTTKEPAAFTKMMSRSKQHRLPSIIYQVIINLFIRYKQKRDRSCGQSAREQTTHISIQGNATTCSTCATRATLSSGRALQQFAYHMHCNNTGRQRICYILCDMLCYMHCYMLVHSRMKQHLSCCGLLGSYSPCQ